MTNLTIVDLKEGNIVEYKGEVIGLIKPDSEALTFLEETIESEDGEYVDVDAPVYIRQRWLVEILPKTVFDKKFRTHRTLEAYYSTYQLYMEEQEKRYGVIDADYISSPHANELGDNFQDLF